MATLADILRQTGYAQGGTLATPAPIESPMTKVLSDHIASLPQKTAQNIEQMNWMVQNSNPYDYTGGKNPYYSYDPKAAEEFANYVPNLMGATAWHGTPHKIKGAFDISKVGTGEGAQAYGHGMYFAENPAVAKEYQKALSGRTDLGQQPSDPAFIHAVESFREYGTPLSQIPAEMKKAYKSATDKDIQLAIQATEKGNLYKVDIPDEQIPNMLDWDKPLNQQSAGVLSSIKIPQKAADRYNEISNKLEELQWTKGGLDSPEWNKLFEEAKDIKAKYGLHRSGEELYREAYKVAQQNGVANPSQAAAESLKAQGIPGIRYLDEGSRSKGTGTSNFVVFDPSTVKILEENGKALTRKELIEQQLNKVIE